MKYKKRHLRQTNRFKKFIATLLFVLVILLIVATVFTFTVISTSDTTTTLNKVQPMTTELYTVTDKNQETIVSSIPLTEKHTIKPIFTKKNIEPTKAIETNCVIPTKNDEIKTNSDEVKTEKIENEENEIYNSNLYEGTSPHYLIDINEPDYSYIPQTVKLSDSEKEKAAKIIMREFGSGGYEACCLQAQAIRDAMICNNYSLDEVLNNYQYNIYSTEYTPNQNCYNAINYIFDSGGLAVPHRILYMYSTHYAYSSWHESQQFVVEYKGVRFFDRW